MFALCQQTPSNRKGHSCVVLGSAMLVYGGLVGMKGSSQDFWSLDFGEFQLRQRPRPSGWLLTAPGSLCATGSTAWSLLSDSQQGPAAGPGCRHGHAAVAHQGCMYLFGGWKGLREQRDLWKWSSTSGTWTSLKNKCVMLWVSWCGWAGDSSTGGGLMG